MRVWLLALLIAGADQASKQWVRSSLGPSPSPRSIFDRSAPVYNVPHWFMKYWKPIKYTGP